MTDSIDPLATRALEGAWTLTAEMRSKLMESLYSTAVDPTAKPREKAAAIRSLLPASRASVDAIRAAASMVDLDEVMVELVEIRRLRDEQQNQEDP
jgi:hypothetical protein